MKFSFWTTRDEFTRAVPLNTGGVYFLYDKNMRLLYVGQTVDFMSRISAHLYGAPIPDKHRRQLFNTFYGIGMIVVDDVEEAMKLEAECIYNYNPPCNVRGRSTKLEKVHCGYGRNRSKRGNKMPKQINLPPDMFDKINQFVARCKEKDRYSKVSFNTVIERALQLYMPRVEELLNE